MAPVVTEGEVTGAGDGRLWTGSVRCLTGHSLVGSATLKCRDGQWSGEIPVCVKLGQFLHISYLLYPVCYLISHHTYHISFSYLIFALQMTVTRPSWRTSVTGGGRCTGGCSTGGRYTGTTVTSHSPCWAASWPGVTREDGDTEGRTGHLSVPVSIQCYICPVCQSSVM